MEFWLARTLAITIGILVCAGLYIFEYNIDKEQGADELRKRGIKIRGKSK